MLELAQPWLLLMLPLPLLSYWLLPPHRQRVSSLRVPFFDALVEITGAEARSGAVVIRRRALQMGLAVGAWVLLVLGLAHPEWVGEPIVRSETARDVMLAIDLSGSMDTRDFPDESGATVRRMDAVQRVVNQFVADRENDRVGLIVFGSRPYVQLPFSRDLETASTLVDLMEVGMAAPKPHWAMPLASRSAPSNRARSTHACSSC